MALMKTITRGLLLKRQLESHVTEKQRKSVKKHIDHLAIHDMYWQGNCMRGDDYFEHLWTLLWDMKVLLGGAKFERLRTAVSADGHIWLVEAMNDVIQGEGRGSAQKEVAA